MSQAQSPQKHNAQFQTRRKTLALTDAQIFLSPTPSLGRRTLPTCGDERWGGVFLLFLSLTFPHSSCCYPFRRGGGEESGRSFSLELELSQDNLMLSEQAGVSDLFGAESSLGLWTPLYQAALASAPIRRAVLPLILPLSPLPPLASSSLHVKMLTLVT